MFPYVFASQNVQADNSPLPPNPVLYVPGRHSKHISSLSAPKVVEKVPSRHREQPPCVDRPVLSPYVPDGQGSQVDGTVAPPPVE